MNKEEPLAIQEKESIKANRALNDYWLMGDGRSLGKLRKYYVNRKKGDKSAYIAGLSCMEAWSSLYEWQARIGAQQDIETVKEREIMRAKRKEFLAAELDIAMELMKKSKQMLSFRVYETTTKDGVTVIKPGDWRVSDISKMFDIGSRRGRISLGMESDRTATHVEVIKDRDTLEQGIIDQIESLVAEQEKEILSELDGGGADTNKI